MSDISAEAVEPVVDEPVVESTEAPVTEPTVAESESPDTTTTDDFSTLETRYDALEMTPGLPTESLTELKDLRREHRNYRQKYQPFEQAFSQWDTDSQKSILSFGRMMTERPDLAPEWLLNSARNLLGDDAFKDAVNKLAATITTPAPASPGQPDITTSSGEPLTRDELMKILADQRAQEQQQTQQQKFLQDVMDKATALGFGPNTGLYYSLLGIAKSKTNGDLDKAAELLRAEIQTAIQAATTPGTTESSNGSPTTAVGTKPTPTPVPRNGTPAGQGSSTLPPDKRAEAAMKARLDGILGKNPS